MPDYPEIDRIADQVSRYSAGAADHWTRAVASWDDARKEAFCAAVRELEKTTTLMYGRVAKIIGNYASGPVRGQPILVFGELPPGGGDFKARTNQLIFRLDGKEYWRYPFTPGMTRRVAIA